MSRFIVLLALVLLGTALPVCAQGLDGAMAPSLRPDSESPPGGPWLAVEAFAQSPPVDLPQPPASPILPGMIPPVAMPPEPPAMLAAPVILEPDEPAPPKLWQGSFQLGIDGASGNNESFNLRLGLSARRRTPINAFTLQADYFKKSNQSIETANRLFAESRFEQFILGTPWTCFAHSTFTYDNFTDYDSLVTGDVGVGRKLLDDETTLFIARLGVGVARTFGAPDNRFVPEAVFGLDYEHRISARQRLLATIDYMPDMTDFRDFRLNTNAGWEYALDQEGNLSLRLTVLDRYDSTSHGKRPNDLDYAVLLLWKF